MKTLEDFAYKHGLTVVKINYRFKNYKFRGYDLIDADNYIQLKIEPVHYSNGDRWLVTDYTKTFTGSEYMKSLRELKNTTISPRNTGFILSTNKVL